MQKSTFPKDRLKQINLLTLEAQEQRQRYYNLLLSFVKIKVGQSVPILKRVLISASQDVIAKFQGPIVVVYKGGRHITVNLDQVHP